MKEENWFIEKIGKKVMCTSSKGFNGEMIIKSETHAKYLCHVAQPRLKYNFEEIKK